MIRRDTPSGISYVAMISNAPGTHEREAINSGASANCCTASCSFSVVAIEVGGKPPLRMSGKEPARPSGSPKIQQSFAAGTAAGDCRTGPVDREGGRSGV